MLVNRYATQTNHAGKKATTYSKGETFELSGVDEGRVHVGDSSWTWILFILGHLNFQDISFLALYDFPFLLC